MTPPTREARRGIFCAALLAVACRGEDPEQHRVKSAVREYNRALVRAQRGQRAELLADAATAGEMMRVSTLIDGLAAGGARLDLRQEALRFESIALAPPDAAEVVAHETWWYRRVDRESGEVRLAPRRVRYRTRYHLVRSDDRWKVDRLDNLETDERAAE